VRGGRRGESVHLLPPGAWRGGASEAAQPAVNLALTAHRTGDWKRAREGDPMRYRVAVRLAAALLVVSFVPAARANDTIFD
jgi:hypothetical protein